MKAFNLRGTNGSGKTTVARAVLKEFGCEIYAMRTAKHPLAYHGKIGTTPLFVLGSYVTDCGGCDTIPSVHTVATVLTELRAYGPGVVFYEGLMISHMIGTVGEAVRSWGIDHVMGFLDTPVGTCIDRVVARRQAAGNDKPFDPNRTLVKDYRAVRRCRENCLRGGFQIVDVPHRNAIEFVLAYLREMAE